MGEGGIPFSGLTTPPVWSLAWISKSIKLCCILFMFSELKWEVVVRFVDIGGNC